MFFEIHSDANWVSQCGKWRIIGNRVFFRRQWLESSESNFPSDQVDMEKTIQLYNRKNMSRSQGLDFSLPGLPPKSVRISTSFGSLKIELLRTRFIYWSKFTGAKNRRFPGFAESRVFHHPSCRLYVFLASSLATIWRWYCANVSQVGAPPDGERRRTKSLQGDPHGKKNWGKIESRCKTCQTGQFFKASGDFDEKLCNALAARRQDEEGICFPAPTWKPLKEITVSPGSYASHESIV